MDEVKEKKIPKGAGARLRELAKKRRENLVPSKELVDTLKSPAKKDSGEKQSAQPPISDLDL